MAEAWRAGEAGRLDWVRPEAGGLCCVRLRPDRFDAAAVARFWAALPRRSTTKPSSSVATPATTSAGETG